MRSFEQAELIALLEAREPGAPLDLRSVGLMGVDLTGVVLDEIDFGPREGVGSRLHGVRFEGATLRRCSFRGAALEHVDFTRAQLLDCSLESATLHDVGFRGATLRDTDIRRADLERASFKGADLVYCDLYRSRLGPGTVFEDTDLSDCSLYLTLLDGVVLPRSAIERQGGDGLLQDRRSAFATYHDRLRERGRGDGRTALHLERRRIEGATVYRALAGHWAHMGAMRDAGWAYVHAKQLETRAMWPPAVHRRRRVEQRFEARPTDPTPGRAGLRWIAGWIAELAAGYGERPLRVAATAVLWVVLFGALFTMRGVAAGDPGDGLLLSVQAVTTTVPTDVELDRLEQLLVSLQAVGGIALLGLFGFTLGNRLRNA